MVGVLQERSVREQKSEGWEKKITQKRGEGMLGSDRKREKDRQINREREREREREKEGERAK